MSIADYGGTVTIGSLKGIGQQVPRKDPLLLERCENGWLARFVDTDETYVFNSDGLLVDFIEMYISDKGEDK